MNAARRGKTLSVSLFRIRGGVREFSSAYVPKSRDMTEHDGEILINFLQRNNSITCLTGAGISTESGIPDYRSKGVGLYDRENHKPILHQEFMRSEVHRLRSRVNTIIWLCSITYAIRLNGIDLFPSYGL